MPATYNNGQAKYIGRSLQSVAKGLPMGNISSPLVVVNRNSELRQSQPRDPWGVIAGRDVHHAQVLRFVNGDQLPYLDLWHMWTATDLTSTSSDESSESSLDTAGVVVTQNPMVRAFGRFYDYGPQQHRQRQWPMDVDEANWGFGLADRYSGGSGFGETFWRPLKDTETDDVAIELPISDTRSTGLDPDNENVLDDAPAMKYTLDGREFYGGLPRFVYVAGMSEVIVTVDRPAVIDGGVGLIVGHFHG